jgi:hypothetical protein
MNLQELEQAYTDGKELIWNDPDPIEGNDYTISFIEKEIFDEVFEDDEIADLPILIQYNGGDSEAQAYLHEITLK